MSKAKKGDTVKVHYTGKLDDGTIFDSSSDREPLEFTIGGGQMIPGFEAAIIGLGPNELTTAIIDPENAYGPHRPELTAVVDKCQFPEDLEPEIGQQLELRKPDDQIILVTVTKIDGHEITLDANHPLAGKKLTFEIKLLEIN